MESDCIWVATKNRRKKDIINEAIRKVMVYRGLTITDITTIQGQFKRDGLWHSFVWFNHETNERN